MAIAARTLSVESCLEQAYESFFQVGGISVQLLADRNADVELLPALEPFRIQSGCPDIRVLVEWVQSLPAERKVPLFDSGTTWRAYETAMGLQFDFNSPALGNEPYKRLCVDGRFDQATLQMNRESFQNCPRDADPLEYPLDELLIMHRLTQEKAIELHGSGIVRANGEADLFIGHSGAGKSTTTRLWTEVEDVEVLSDDRIIVRRDRDAAVVETRRDGTGSTNRREVLRFAQDDNAKGTASSTKYQMRMYGTPWHGEAMYASPNSAPLTRIFVLEHGRGNVITPLTSSQAVAELFARSFVPFHRHEYVDSALEFLQELVNAVPVYRYAFEPDQRAVEKIRNFHD